MSDPEQEISGVFLRAIVEIQCLGCGEVFEAQVKNQNPADTENLPDDVAECPHCTQASGTRTVIPLCILVGDQVHEVFEDGDGDDEDDDEQLQLEGGPDGGAG